eukprot:GHVR01085037.1.p1 GENE.GHVR01085037.1~~GHVR01085037.1.p1  ORF type:complete len:112 (-),score=44.53 GHVR01085037.1:39-374(-)
MSYFLVCVHLSYMHMCISVCVFVCVCLCVCVYSSTLLNILQSKKYLKIYIFIHKYCFNFFTILSHNVCVCVCVYRWYRVVVLLLPCVCVCVCVAPCVRKSVSSHLLRSDIL